MKKNKFLMMAVIASLTVSGVYADDFDFGNDDFGFGDFGGDSGSSSAVELSGQVTTDTRAYLDQEKIEKPENVKMDGCVNADVNLKYSGTKADAEVKLNFNSETLAEHPEDILDEAFVTAYAGNFKLDAGLMKNVWGKGDKLHVIDNLNADDYSDFIIPDYLDRRVATPMLKGTYAFDYSGKVLSNLKMEAVYTPFLPVDKFAESGVWVPSQVSALTGNVKTTATDYLASTVKNLENARLLAAEVSSLNALSEQNDLSAKAALNAKVQDAYSKGYITADSQQIVALMSAGKTQAEAQALVLGAAYSKYIEENLTNANLAYTTALNNASALSNNTGMIYPDINSFKYSQAGARVTGSLGCFDWGLSYYYGYYKQPSVNVTKITPYIEKYLSGTALTEEDKFLAYDQKQTFGIEAATILWHFNLRGEACYNLTKDTKGDDPFVHNNSIQWLGGFDIDVPLWNMNINVQETGTYVLGNDKIKGSTTELFDVDYNANGYSNNKIVANISTSFANDKFAPEVSLMYGIEGGDFVVLPKFTYKPTSEVSLIASGMYINCKNDKSEFAAWKNNSFIQLGVSISY